MIKKILRFQKEASFGMTVLLTVAIVVVLNVFAQELFVRFDLTRNSDYSISPVSRDVIKNLDDVVNIKTYFSSDAPSQIQQVKRDVTDVLASYQDYSGGKIKVANIDPSKDESLKMELQNKGIPQLQFNDYAQDKLQVVNGYMGMAIEYGDKTEVIPVIQDTNNFEYQLTTKIKKITNQDPATIGYVTNASTTNLSAELKGVRDSLSGLYELQPVDLVAKGDIAKDIKTLLVVNPNGKFGDAALKKLDSFLMNGGSLAIFAGGVTVANGLQASANQTDINKLIEKYGLKINKDLVLDSSAGIASFNQGFITFSIDYPFWPKMMKDNFSNNPAVARLSSLVFPWPSSIDIAEQADDDGRKTEILAKSSANSWTATETFDLNPQQPFSPTNFEVSPMAVLMSGKINSAYGKASTDKGRLLVVSNGLFMNDSFIQNQPDNGNFFFNIIDALTLEQNFAQIRAKGVTNHPIRTDLSDAEKNSMRYGNVFGLTLAVVAIGTYRYIGRRKKHSQAV